MQKTSVGHPFHYHQNKKKLCFTSTFIEQGDVPWREQTQEWKQNEEENNAGVRDYHVDYHADYYNINESD